ncbi:hypothetical protein BJ322DRAFT_1079473 [Thelephora terrestris]|uniref:F-box domain-containing protein n=1 Tax=Thelephora terrestris TaxID=56493 RepID=A0A9P6H7K4_9AGAM|nr:hypothetical protein BJ322DRAFT_1079473 [Thelephora terrestris]
MDPALRLTDAQLLQEVGAKLIREANSFSVGYEPPISTVKSLEHDVATALAMLRRRINAHESSIYRLHPELLSLAASHLPKQVLVKATHVSHRLRTIFLSFPRLWSEIGFYREKQASAFLERSKSTPIDVFMSFPHRPSNATATDFLNLHAARIKALTMTGVKDDISVLLPPMPSLKMFNLCWDRLRAEIADGMDKLTLPTVTTLSIRGALVAFPFSVPQLTRLHVHSRVTLAETKLLDFLSGCPFLEDLEVGYNNITPVERDRCAIDLPRLRFYSHCTSTNVHLSLFDKLYFPPSCSTVFNYWNGPKGARQKYDVLPFYNPSPLADTKRVHLKTNHDGDAIVELIDAEDTRVCLVVNVELDSQDLSGDDHRRINESYASYLETIDTGFIEVLCVEASSPWTPDHAEEVLSHLGKLRTLVLSGSVVMPYILALCPDSKYIDDHDGSIDPTRWWWCPVLDALVVHTPELHANYQDILQHLYMVAQRRKDVGIPFKSVSLFVRKPWDEYVTLPMESCPALKQLRGCIEKLEIKTGDDALDWNVDDYFFDGLDVRRDRHSFEEQRNYLWCLI